METDKTAAAQQHRTPCRGELLSVSLAACCPLVKVLPAGGWSPRPPARQGQGRFPIGNGHAPGIDTGRGASGTEGSAAGWAARPPVTGRFPGATGFFLAAFFLADFLVGFFLAVRPAAARLPAFFLPAALFRPGLFLAGLFGPALAGRFLRVANPVLGFLLAAFCFFRAAFFFAAMSRLQCQVALTVSARPRKPCSPRPDKGHPDRA
jgi:hypothetical protein